ncbi:MAG: FHA domain-containing protein [Myxococcota bacterium]
MNKPFRIVVSLPGEPPRAFEFDSDEVIVGRGDGVTLDLRVPAVSRRQLTIRRTGGGLTVEAEPGATNPTLVGGAPVSRHALAPGDVISIGPVSLHVAPRTARPREPRAARPRSNARVIAAAATCVALLALVVAGARRSREKPSATPSRAEAIFPAPAKESCPGAEACAARARAAEALGRRLEARGRAAPAELYAAVLQYRRALGYLAAGGLPGGAMAGLAAREQAARERFMQELDDGLFRLRRAEARRDGPLLQREALALAAMLPDASHPLRRRMENLAKEGAHK